MDLQDHKGNEVIDHPQYHSEGGMDHVERPDANKTEDAVQQTVILQDTHPCVGTHQHIDPCGQGDEHDPEKTAFFRPLCNSISNGVAQKDADDRGHNSDHHGAFQNVDENLIRQETGKVIQRKTEGRYFVARCCKSI